MAQWDVYPNPSPRSRDVMPYLVVVQSDLLASLPTRLVVPLARTSLATGDLPGRLAPLLEVAGERCALRPHEAGSIPKALLRRRVTSLRGEAHRIVDAMDAVISGI